MPIDRHFLGWDKPALPAAAHLLRERYSRDGRWDLGDIVIAVPGGRAGRRLLELIAESAASERDPLVLTPPKIVTVGRLPEELALMTDVAEPLHVLLAWIKALRTAPPGMLDGLIDHAPQSDDLTAWLGLANDMERLHAEIAAEGLGFADISMRCLALCNYDDSARWNRLDRLHAHYLAVLTTHGRDRHDARRRALETAFTGRDAATSGSFQTDKQIVLIAAIDLPEIAREMLRATPMPVLSLIHAPESERDAFDDVGCLLVDAWQDRPLPFGPQAIKIVDTPRDQAFAALERIEPAEERFGPDQITVGLGDPKMSGLIESLIEISGRPVRPAPSHPVTTARPARLLAALADQLEDDRCRHFAALVRHPDLAAYLAALPEIGDSAPLLPHLLDAYITERIPFRMSELFPSGQFETPTPLQRAALAVQNLLRPLSGQKRLLGEWTEPIAEVLRRIYGERAFAVDSEETLPIVTCLRALAAQLRLQREQAMSADLSGPATAADALRFTLAQIASELLPEESDEAAIELLGWLELLLDDAPFLVVTGMNEGNVPESMNADIFLPDRLRRGLGLRDNRARYARDAYSLRAMLASKAEMTLICGRVGPDNDPLRPSRLLFACDEHEIVSRALQFYKTTEHPTQRILLPHGATDTLALLPLPIRQERPLARLSVTAFRDYLQCPYRFYLKHVLRLRQEDDFAVEMDARLLGTITHDVLSDFAGGPARDSIKSTEIIDYLTERLEYHAERLFGKKRLPAVEIQIRQLGRKLAAFGEFQARHAAAGWRIAQNECDASETFQFDGSDLKVDGRIDRIDHNAESGRYLILDYKITTSAPDPEKRHRLRKTDWIDLQLPLYRRLAPSLGIAPDTVDLGYIGLGKDLDAIDLKPARWTDADYESANARADEVMHAVVNQIFWPPSADLPRFSDGLEAICRDAALDRARIIGRLTQEMAKGGER